MVIADNRLPEQAVWDFDLLREHFKELIDLDFDVELTGFSTGEIDLERGELELHPTVKPVALVADLIRDCSRRNGIILDPFGGSGTTILAAERTGRIARVIELDPLYVDLAVRRWEQTTGMAARHAGLGLNLTDLAAQRATPEPSSEPRYPEVIPSGED